MVDCEKKLDPPTHRYRPQVYPGHVDSDVAEELARNDLVVVMMDKKGYMAEKQRWAKERREEVKELRSKKRQRETSYEI